MATEIEARADRPMVARRRFTLLDIAILVAATACGCAVDGFINRALTGQESRSLLDLLGQMFATRQYSSFALGVMLLALPLVVAWTLALIPLRLMGPRPSLRRLSRQPGWMATCGFAVGLAFAAAVVVAVVIFKGPARAFDLLELSMFLPIVFAPAILAAWMGLILGRRWRPERSWIDRLGRVMGVFWVATAAVGMVVGVMTLL